MQIYTIKNIYYLPIRSKKKDQIIGFILLSISIISVHQQYNNNDSTFQFHKTIFVRDAQDIVSYIITLHPCPQYHFFIMSIAVYRIIAFLRNIYPLEVLVVGMHTLFGRKSKRSECNLTLLFSNIQINQFLMLYLMSKKQSKEFNDDNNNNELRSLELSTNVNDYDTGESIDCDNIADTTNMEKKTPRTDLKLKNEIN
ncbi:MAG: hypothetical protein JO297_10680 [Nitrososphaeraceae archaeon]|nr:hypothetical protein [Nitrososphaeraceae archaeon]